MKTQRIAGDFREVGEENVLLICSSPILLELFGCGQRIAVDASVDQRFSILPCQRFVPTIYDRLFINSEFHVKL